ncbi:hypothetical protein [Umezakia ovalisporum]|uniref:Uncharacterized protein n=1 Tax=Umezakia ovalisporum FSS-62 TaxID=2971776 RepID=A0AA43KEX8_9CYAN|nr:hypothetical protein [Umezakia ovalisporum]MDH6063373.1 hypothetical protein [Umezakia ovalisporum FSS-62]
MIPTIVESAFQTGYLSLESKGLLNQVLATKCCGSEDLLILSALCAAVSTGPIKMKASLQLPIELARQCKIP